MKTYDFQYHYPRLKLSMLPIAFDFENSLITTITLAGENENTCEIDDKCQAEWIQNGLQSKV